MEPNKMLAKLTLGSTAICISAQLYAAAFQLNEFSSIGLGRAYSGEGAMADSAADVSRNPATMTLMERPTISVGAILIDPDVNIDSNNDPLHRLKANNIIPAQWIPNIHYVQPINNRWWLGTFLTSHYGMATQYNNAYPAGPYAGKTNLMSGNINFSTAYRFNQHFSFGAGLNAVFAKAIIERYAGELGQKLAMPAETLIASLKGEKWAFGWNTGVLYEVNDNHRFSFTYLSNVKVNFNGNYKSNLPTILNAKTTDLPYATNGKTLAAALTLDLPEVWTLSGYHKVAPQWAVHYTVFYTRWSQFQPLKAIGSAGQTLFYKDQDYQNAYRLALGTSYFYNDNWTFRTGLAFDEHTVTTNKRSIAIPDQDRLWFSMGGSYAFNQQAAIDIGIAYMHGQKVSIAEGQYTFTADGKAWLYGASFNYQF